jgi:hypothetical protein
MLLAAVLGQGAQAKATGEGGATVSLIWVVLWTLDGITCIACGVAVYYACVSVRALRRTRKALAEALRFRDEPSRSR